jgi:starch-binding outer membrane protein, SusD/RagB family
MKLIKITISIFLGMLLLVFTGCKKDWLNVDPLTELADASFWKTESDAMLALTGLYPTGVGDQNGFNRWRWIQMATDDARYKSGGPGTNGVGQFMQPNETSTILLNWTSSYKAIYRVNVFLANIDKVTMDATKKSGFIAEARFIRANEYFWMLQWWGGVPLVTKVLTISEANNQKRNSRQEIVDFCLTELTAAAVDLPASRDESEKGRIIKGAAQALKGRLLMIEKRWSEASVAFKEIIDSDVHIIDPRYKKIFEEEGETSKEIILSANFVAGLYGNGTAQLNLHPAIYGGYQEYNAFQDLVDAFLMNDGLPIEESPLYDPANPFANRDPRLYANMFLPEYTVFRGTLYLANPDLTDFGIKSLNGATGYGCKKFVTENYTGDINSSGDDVIYIRYAEVLLGYLESKLEAGDNITQDLLNQTINKVRAREEVNMPPVTETDPDKLREIVRRERRVEFCWEPYIRYMDITRWGIASQAINRKFYGMKLTDDPSTYTEYPVDETGHLFSIDKTGFFEPNNDLWPIPQTEIDINPALGQNPGYSK